MFHVPWITIRQLSVLNFLPFLEKQLIDFSLVLVFDCWKNNNISQVVKHSIRGLCGKSDVLTYIDHINLCFFHYIDPYNYMGGLFVLILNNFNPVKEDCSFKCYKANYRAFSLGKSVVHNIVCLSKFAQIESLSIFYPYIFSVQMKGHNL